MLTESSPDRSPERSRTRAQQKTAFLLNDIDPRRGQDRVRSAPASATLAGPGAHAVRGALQPLIEAYAKWIDTQRTVEVGTQRRAEVRDELMRRAEEAKARIAEGIELLARDGEALEAFRLANRAMATAARRRNPERYREEGIRAGTSSRSRFFF